MANILSKIFVQLDKKFFLQKRNRDYLQRAASIFLPPRLLPGESILIVAVAYNQFQCLVLQQRFLARNLNDPFAYVIADNSTDTMCARAIADFCKEHAIGYAKLPPNPYSGIDGSLSHGLALNWAYTNIVKPMSPSFFGLIDHDIFPGRPTRIIELLRRQGAFGVIEERPRISKFWYLWAGLMFFSSAWAEDEHLNFLPVLGLDTGGGNYRALTRADKTKMVKKLTLFEVPQLRPVKLETAGDWVHLFRSYDESTLKAKAASICDFLDKNTQGY